MPSDIGGPARRVAQAYHAGQGQDERALGHQMEALRASIERGPRAALTWRDGALLTAAQSPTEPGTPGQVAQQWGEFFREATIRQR
jgi:hypothetical protein